MSSTSKKCGSVGSEKKVKLPVEPDVRAPVNLRVVEPAAKVLTKSPFTVVPAVATPPFAMLVCIVVAPCLKSTEKQAFVTVGTA